VAAAKVKVSSERVVDRQAVLRELEAAVVETKASGWVLDGREARLALCEAELAAGQGVSARLRLVQLENEARAAGDLFIARQATALLGH
jgi:hypothetical protein